MKTDKLRAEERDNSHGDEVRRNQGENHCAGERDKEKAANSIKKYDREKHDCCSYCGSEKSEGNFLSALFGSHLCRFAHFQMPENVFEHDDGVIDQGGKGERQSA